MKVLIVAGGSVDKKLLRSVTDSDNYYIIGVDGGLNSLIDVSQNADLAIGDFDSASDETIKEYIDRPTTIRLNTHKDYSDTYEAVMEALKLSPEHITILGGTGNRLDHVLANLGILKICCDKGVSACILDTNNRIRIIKDGLTIYKGEQYGRYVSFVPFTDEVTGICLTGFEYNLSHATFKKEEAIGISNEIREEEGSITIEKGYMMVIESRD